jgi:hypothetical protein
LVTSKPSAEKQRNFILYLKTVAQAAIRTGAAPSKEIAGSSSSDIAGLMGWSLDCQSTGIDEASDAGKLPA